MTLPNQSIPDPAVQRNFRELDKRTATMNFARSPEQQLRMIRGTFTTTTPTIVAGTGFTLTRNGVGDVTVNFSTAFSTVPSVTISTTADATNLQATPAVGSVRILTRNGSPLAAAEATVCFSAIGPN